MNIKTTRPNFLVCVVDQMQSYSIGYNGNNEVSTPNIDTIAKEGVSFMRAYCNNPVCMPSRATMLTGLTPKQHGCITNGTILNTQIPTVTKALVDNGYRTHLVGKPHLQPFGAAGNNGENEKFSWESKNRWDKEEIKSLPKMYYGFETSDFVGGHGEYCFGDYVNWLKKNHSNIYEKYKQDNSYFKNEKAPSSWRMDLPHELHYNNWIVDKSIEFINDIKQDQNFFLWCSFPDPHVPFAACKPYSEMYDPKEVSLNPNWQEEKDFLQHLKNRRKQFSYNNQFDEEGLREIVSQTYGMITHIDDNIGRLIDAIT